MLIICSFLSVKEKSVLKVGHKAFMFCFCKLILAICAAILLSGFPFILTPRKSQF